MKPNAIDERFVADLLNPTHPTVVTVTAQQVSEKLAGLAAFGVTVVCQPVGSDIARAAPSLVQPDFLSRAVPCGREIASHSLNLHACTTWE